MPRLGWQRTGALAQLIGTLIVMFSFEVTAQPAVKILGVSAAVVSINHELSLFIGLWTVVAGRVIQVGLAFSQRKEPVN